ncbi:copper transporter 4-like [Eucalyptus grandis]|uniref:copper transporter 4-like n=1 Tax=Eucalyptus grandis TaxID=71139 RepID=UPI000527F4B9|nr:copper transporter 4-like [Eucalyptus grandis]
MADGITSHNTELNNPHVRHGNRLMAMHMSWGHDTVFLTDRWPGNDPAMFSLAIIFVFCLAFLIMFLLRFEYTKPGTTKVGACLFKTELYTVRLVVSYMVMLAVVSYNGGIFLAAVSGHAVGFLIFRSRLFGKWDHE